MKALLEKFHQLSEREKYLVIISMVAVVIAIFYWLIWEPLHSELKSTREAVQSKRTDLIWMQRSAVKAIQLRSSGGSASFSGSLPQAVNQAASRLQIAIARMQPQGEELKVWVDEAPFNDVLSWLQALERQGINIIMVDLAEANAPGLVKVRSLQLGKS